MQEGLEQHEQGFGDGLRLPLCSMSPSAEAGRAAIWPQPLGPAVEGRALAGAAASPLDVGYSWRHPSLAAEMFGIDGWGRTEATWGPEWAEVGLVGITVASTVRCE